MMRISIVAAAVLGLSCGLAQAQLALPGAAGATPEPGATAPHKTDSSDKPDKADKGGKPASLASSPRALADRPLRLDGNRGRLLLSDRDKTLRIEKLSLAGEVISDPSRKCLIDIVADAPIETKSLGKPDGLARFEAEIPACTFTFDVLDGAVLVPAQERACVFQAADCQANPAGLWGPDPTTLHADAKAIGQRRTRLEAAADRSLRAIQARLKGKPEADDVAREDTDLTSRRDEVCRNYLQEATYAFCASRLAQTRAALLKARLDALQRKAPAPDASKD
jgi:hypothetical protein